MPETSDRPIVEIDASHLQERHVTELRTHADKLRWQMTHDERPAPEHGWTCFHCAQTFTSWAAASAHFGEDPLNGRPACSLAPPTTRRALEVILSRCKMDPETERILKYHLMTERNRDG